MWLKKNLTPILSVSLFLAVIIFQLLILGNRTLWFDEAYSWQIANNSLGKLLELTQLDAHPISYYFLLNLWIGLFGDSTFSLRLPSLIFFVLLCVGLKFLCSQIWLLGEYPLKNTRTAKDMEVSKQKSNLFYALTLILVTLNPIFFRYAQDTRMYMMGICLCAWSFFFLVKIINFSFFFQRGEKSLNSTLAAKEIDEVKKESIGVLKASNLSNNLPLAWGGYFFTTTLFLHTQYFALFSYLSQIFFVFLLTAFTCKLPLSTKGVLTHFYKSLRPFLLCGLLIGLVSLPWIPIFLKQQANYSQNFWLPIFSIKAVIISLRELIVPYFVVKEFKIALVIVALVSCLIFVVFWKALLINVTLERLLKCKRTVSSLLLGKLHFGRFLGGLQRKVQNENFERKVLYLFFFSAVIFPSILILALSVFSEKILFYHRYLYFVYLFYILFLSYCLTVVWEMLWVVPRVLILILFLIQLKFITSDFFWGESAIQQIAKAIISRNEPGAEVNLVVASDYTYLPLKYHLTQNNQKNASQNSSSPNSKFNKKFNVDQNLRLIPFKEEWCRLQGCQFMEKTEFSKLHLLLDQVQAANISNKIDRKFEDKQKLLALGLPAHLCLVEEASNSKLSIRIQSLGIYEILRVQVLQENSGMELSLRLICYKMLEMF